MHKDDLKKIIRDIPDFPKKGIIFKDITTLLSDAQAFRYSLEELFLLVKDKDIDLVVGIESRGFIFGAALALRLGVGFAPVRKKGKLPAKTRSITYSLEYGEDTVEMHEDAVNSGMRVLIVDDLLATGGTASAVVRLVQELGGVVVGLAVIVELDFLEGRRKLKEIDVLSVIHY